MNKVMFEAPVETVTYFNPGDMVRVKHGLENRPVMLVVEKVQKNLINNATGERETVFLGIRCRWFNKQQDLQEAIFSTKDLEHVNI